MFLSSLFTFFLSPIPIRSFGKAALPYSCIAPRQFCLLIWLPCSLVQPSEICLSRKGLECEVLSPGISWETDIEFSLGHDRHGWSSVNNLEISVSVKIKFLSPFQVKLQESEATQMCLTSAHSTFPLYLSN